MRCNNRYIFDLLLYARGFYKCTTCVCVCVCARARVCVRVHVCLCVRVCVCVAGGDVEVCRCLGRLRDSVLAPLIIMAVCTTGVRIIYTVMIQTPQNHFIYAVTCFHDLKKVRILLTNMLVKGWRGRGGQFPSTYLQLHRLLINTSVVRFRHLLLLVV